MPRANGISVTLDTVLLETDAPELVLARDVVGTGYLCSLTRLSPDGHDFLAVQVSSQRLADFRAGRIDLRSVLTEPEIEAWWAGRLPPTEWKSIDLSLIERVPEEWLPDEGFYLSELEEESADEEVVRQALGNNASVVLCNLNPPEARTGIPRIDADRLAEFVRTIQSLVRHAGKRAVSGMPARRRPMLGPDPYSMQAFAFSGGSFTVHFQSKERGDLFGTSGVGLAMRQIDELMALAELPIEQALAGFRGKGGHLLAAYRSLMRLVADENVPFKYRWSEPGMASAAGFGVSPGVARALVAALDSEEALTVEPFGFRGQFTSVNTDRKPLSWTAREESGKTRRGFVHDKTPKVLEGVTIRTQWYRFGGEERLVREASGKQAVNLFLTLVAPS